MAQHLRQLGMLLALLLTTTWHAAAAAPKTITGSKELVTRTLIVEPFHAIHAGQNIEVLLVDASGQPDSLAHRLRVEINANLAEHLVAETRNGCLHLSFDSWHRSLRRIHAVVTVPVDQPLTSLEASSAASIRTQQFKVQSDDLKIGASSAAELDLDLVATNCTIDASSAAELDLRLAATNCTIGASSAAELNLDLRAANCTIDASSAADLNMSGSVTQCTASVSSGASIDAPKCPVTTAHISASSGGSVRLLCTEFLKARASSGGSIHYSGDCRVDPHISLGGSLSR